MSLGRSKKPTTAPMTAEVWRALADMSKAALMDCLADALTLLDGGSDPAGRARERLGIEAVAEFCNPRLRLRGDRLIGRGA